MYNAVSIYLYFLMAGSNLAYIAHRENRDLFWLTICDMKYTDDAHAYF